jgi:hypothetical protein
MEESVMGLGHYAGAFFAGMFLLNAVPHFVKGVCGDKFPTPFAKPPGKGLSSAPVNMVWALFNFLVGHVLWHVSQPLSSHGEMLTFFACFAAFAIWLSVHFQHKHVE